MNKIFDPLDDEISSVELVQYLGSDKMIVNAARVSYGKDVSLDDPVNDKDIKLIKRLIKDNHGTPLEHNILTYRITAPLYVIQEMLRHRVGVSTNQASHRYIEPMSKEDNIDNKYYIPKIFRRQDPKNKQSSFGFLSESDNREATEKYKSTCQKSFETYKRLIEIGAPRELARGVLPHSTYSSLYYTMNLRSLLHFLGLRMEPSAQLEIQKYARAMYELAKPVFPHVFKIIEDLKEEKENEQYSESIGISIG